MICTGITENSSKLNVKVYPVPARNYIWIDLNAISENINIHLLNTEGRPLKEIKVNNTNNNEKLKLDLETLPTGLYYLLFTNDKGEVLIDKSIVKTR